MDFRTTTRRSASPRPRRDKEIKQAFRKLARKFHPDVNPGDKAAEARFKEINEANEVLGDPEKRQEVRRARRQLARVRAGRGAGRRRRAFGGTGRRAVGRGGGSGPMTPRGDGGPVRGRRASVLGFLHDVLRRRRAGCPPRQARTAGRTHAHAAGPTSSTRCSSRSTTRSRARRGDSRSRTAGTRARSTCASRPASRDGARVRVTGEGEPGTAARRPAISTCGSDLRPTRSSSGRATTC